MPSSLIQYLPVTSLPTLPPPCHENQNCTKTLEVNRENEQTQSDKNAPPSPTYQNETSHAQKKHQRAIYNRKIENIYVKFHTAVLKLSAGPSLCACADSNPARVGSCDTARVYIPPSELSHLSKLLSKLIQTRRVSIIGPQPKHTFHYSLLTSRLQLHQ